VEEEVYTEADIPVYDESGKWVEDKVDLKTLKEVISGWNIEQVLALHYWAGCQSLGKKHPYIEVVEQEINRRTTAKERVWSYEEIFNTIIKAGHNSEDVTSQIGEITAEHGVWKSVAAVMVAEKLGIHLDGSVLTNNG